MDLSDYGCLREFVIPAKAGIQYVFSSRMAANQRMAAPCAESYVSGF
jgi:hypothetical protein